MNFVNPQYLIEPEALASLLAEPDLRIVDATVFLVPAEKGYRAESGLGKYREAHIAGAAFMDLIKTFSDTSSGLGFTLPAPQPLGAAVGTLGIGNTNPVVVYSSGHLMWATRAFWLLRHAGHDNVRVLNGGLDGWRAAGLPIRSGDEHYARATFTPRPRPDMFVDLAGMRAATGTRGVCTINALSPAVYAGTGDMHYGRRGHIPGSLNVHYEALLEGARFAAPRTIHETLSTAGLLDAPRIIAYCGGGISATIDAFACLLMGQEQVAVYDGSMSEWVRDPSLPLAVGETP